MSNIFDYLEWRGDLTFQQSRFNAVDNLILTTVAYLFFDSVFKGEPISLRKAASDMMSVPQDGKKMRVGKDEELLYAMGSSRRFQDVLLIDYVSEFDPKLEKQFAAMCFQMDGNSIFVAFRGTDNTLVGWKEDFNMGFLSAVPAQLEAAAYLKRIGKKYPGDLILGGHSKGGNLAGYAAAFCGQEIQERIIWVFNNDGPGFQENITARPEFKAVEERIHTFVPQSSIIGMLLDHEDTYTVVHSTQIGILQHDPYTWEVKADDFIRLKTIDAGSQVLDKAMKKWIQGMNTKQREAFVNTLFEILMSTNVESVQGLPLNLLKNAPTLAKTYISEDEEDRKAMSDAVKLLLKSVKDTVLAKGGLDKTADRTFTL